MYSQQRENQKVTRDLARRLEWEGSKKQSRYLSRFTRRYLRLRYRAICYNSRPFWPVHSIDYCAIALFIFSLQQLGRSLLSSLFSSLFLAPTSSLINICQYRKISEKEIDFLSLYDLSLSLSLSLSLVRVLDFSA